MKTVFISQPMGGKSSAEIMKVRAEARIAIGEILGEDFNEIVDFILDTRPNVPSLWYLGKSLTGLAYADIAYFAPGWKNARSCIIEHICAIAYGIKIIEAPEEALK